MTSFEERVCLKQFQAISMVFFFFFVNLEAMMIVIKKLFTLTGLISLNWAEPLRYLWKYLVMIKSKVNYSLFLKAPFGTWKVLGKRKKKAKENDFFMFGSTM